MTSSATVRLTKLHGLGNDFLVHLVDDADPERDERDLARRVCARHHGVGADGLLTAKRGTGDVDWVMTLHNADGSRAEMSGNGIRCFAHALVRAEDLTMPASMRIATDGGIRVVQVEPDATDPDIVHAKVDMGAAKPGPEIGETGHPQARTVHRLATRDMGNPHLVLLVDDPNGVDLAVEGPAWEALFPEGVNVHFIDVPSRDVIELAVWERGAGITEACGTGACAAADVAAGWGLVDREVIVKMPGGDVAVSVGESIVLTGPSEWIADVEVAT